VDLEHALPRREVARRRDLLDQRFDVGAEELEAAVAALADQMKVARMAIGVLEPEIAAAEVDPAGDPGIDHPLESAIDGRPADALIFTPDDVDEIVGAQVSLLLEEHVQYEVALARSLAAGRAEAGEIQGISRQ